MPVVVSSVVTIFEAFLLGYYVCVQLKCFERSFL